MDRATRLRMDYTAMLLRAYSRRMQDAPGEVAAFEAKLREPRHWQESTLAGILTANATTEYGRRHGFATLAGYAEYRRRVPVVGYEDLRPAIERMLAGERDLLVRGAPSYFSTTSGATADPKFIPGAQGSIVAGCEAILARNACLRRDHPRAFAGRALFIVGNAAEGRTAAGASYGAMTGFGYYAGQIGFPGRPFPYEVFTLRDYATRYRTILRLALAARDLSAISVYNPSTLLLLLEKAAGIWDQLIEEIAAGGLPVGLDAPEEVRAALLPELGPDPDRAAELAALRDAGPRAWWPRLAVLLCWKGGSLSFYFEELRRWIGDLPVRDLGILASEAVVTIGVDDTTAGGVLLPESAFFEFVPEDGEDREPRGAWELEDGARYRLLLTTHGGLYRYDLADVVRVERHHFASPVLTFLHRAGRVHSFTGEKLTEHQVTLAVRAAAAAAGLRLASFTAIPQWGLPPRYELRAELAEGEERERCPLFARLLDEELKKVNLEYAGKRDSGRLAAAGLVLVAAGGFEALRRRRTAQDAQYKEVHLVCDPGLAPQLEILETVS